MLELLSAHQITVPEIGTIKARHVPFVILTSNATRELGDALRRRCLYYWMEYPDPEKELAVVKKHHPQVDVDLASQVVNFVHALRPMKLDKAPGLAETIDWVAALTALGKDQLDAETVSRTLGCVLKSEDDLKRLQPAEIEAMISS